MLRYTVMWPFRRAATRSERIPVADDPNLCRKCGERIEVNRDLSGVLEGMHWLCFHLAFEHDTDPDTPCSDVSGCPWWTIRHYERKLRELGLDPEAIRFEAIDAALERNSTP